MIWYITGTLSAAFIGGVIGWVLHHYRTKAKIDVIRRAANAYRKLYHIAISDNRALHDELAALRVNQRREVYDYKKEEVR